MQRPRNFYVIGSLLLVGMIVAVSLIVIGIRQQQQQPPQTQGQTTPTTITTPNPITVTTTPGGKALYVSPSGNNDNDGSKEHPFATINRADSAATPGTIVHVLPGNYTGAVVIEHDGTANARITYISDTRWAAKIKTTNDDDPWTTKADYIDIIGFDVSSDGARDGIENRGSYTRTIGNRVHNIPGTCDNIGGSGIDDGNYQAHDNDIIGNVVFNIGETYPKLCEYVHAIYHSNARGHIYNNIVYNNAGVGINLWHAATGTIVSNNLSFGNMEHGISIGTDKGDNDGDEGNNFIVTNNIVINNALLGIRERKGVGDNNKYSNNIVYGNKDGNFGDENYDWPPKATDSKDVSTFTKQVQFVNFKDDGSGDYHLTANSPGVDEGTKLGAPTTDFDGKPRPKGKGFDIGPYEYQAAS